MHRRLSLPLLAALPALLAMTACTAPETKLRVGLREAGVSKPMANCLADYMVDRLSPEQMQRVVDLADPDSPEFGSLTVEQFLRNAQALKDPVTASVASKVAVICPIVTKEPRPRKTRKKLLGIF